MTLIYKEFTENVSMLMECPKWCSNSYYSFLLLLVFRFWEHCACGYSKLLGVQTCNMKVGFWHTWNSKVSRTLKNITQECQFLLISEPLLELTLFHEDVSPENLIISGMRSASIDDAIFKGIHLFCLVRYTRYWRMHCFLSATPSDNRLKPPKGFLAISGIYSPPIQSQTHALRGWASSDICWISIRIQGLIFLDLRDCFFVSIQNWRDHSFLNPWMPAHVGWIFFNVQYKMQFPHVS